MSITNGTIYTHSLTPNKTLAGSAIRGDGAYTLGTNETTLFPYKDFVIVQSGRWTSRYSSFRSNLRIFLIEVPTEVDYPL